MSYFSRLVAYGQADAGLPSTITPGTTTTTVLPSSLVIHAGNSVTGTALNQVLLQGTTTTNAHAIKTRHNAAGTSDNAIDLFIWQYGTDTATSVGSRQALTVAQTGVGINQPYPTSALQVGGTITATGNIVAGGGLIGAFITQVYPLTILWQQTGALTVPANTAVTPALSVWTVNATYSIIPSSMSTTTIMASSGAITIPVKGVYTINWCFDFPTAENPLSFWFAHSTLGRLASNSFYSLNAYSVVTGNWTGLLLLNDVLTPTLGCSAATSLPATSPPNVYNYLSIVLLYAVQ